MTELSKEVRIFSFSDWRVQDISALFALLKKYGSDADVIVYCGDDLDRFQRGERNLLSELSRSVSIGKVLAVAGNDDSRLTKGFLKARGVHDLHEEPFSYGDLVFVGAEGSTTPPGLLLHSEEEIAENLLRLIENAQGRKMILVSHTPPHRCLDYGVRFAPKGEGVHHIGSTAVRDFVLQHSPELVLCGHAHTMGGRTEKLGESTVVNVSSHDNPYAEGNVAYIAFDRVGGPKVDWHTTREVFGSGSVITIHGVGPRRRERLEAAGVSTVEQLAYLEDYERVASVTRFSLGHLRKLSLKARAVREGRIYQVQPFVQPPSPVFFDIETDLHQNRIWMIGSLHGTEFNTFYADDWTGERTILSEFLEYLESVSGSTLVSFSGTNFDGRVCRKAIERLGLNLDLFCSLPHIDLCSALRRSFIFPYQTFALKDFASSLGFEFRHPEMTGLDVALAYHDHIRDGTPLPREIPDYNEDDVRALPFIIDVLLEASVKKQKGAIELVVSEAA